MPTTPRSTVMSPSPNRGGPSACSAASPMPPESRPSALAMMPRTPPTIPMTILSPKFTIKGKAGICASGFALKMHLEAKA